MSERLSIGEFARRTGLSVSALRFYDGRGLLVPASVDPRTSYRTYAAAQLGNAELIRDLRRLDMPLAAIPEFLTAGPELRRKALHEHLAGLSRRLREVEEITRRLEDRILAMEEPMTTMTVEAATFGEAIDQVLPAASTDPEFPALQTVLVEAKDGSLRLVATDRYRLAVRDVVAFGGHDAVFRAVVAAAGLARIRPAVGTDGKVTIERQEAKLRVALVRDDTNLEVVPAEFPNYERLMAMEREATSIVVDRVEFGAALEARLGTDIVRLVLHDGGLRIEGDTPTELTTSYVGPEVVIGVNPTFAHYAVSAAIGPELVIEVADPLKHLVFRSVTDSSYICMLMPVRLT